MKIIRLDDDNSKAVMADSAIAAKGTPLFLPEGQWECQFRVAVRVDRLGKAVNRKFASRYYRHFTVANYLRPINPTDTDGVAYDAIDDAIVLGEWLPIDDDRYDLLQKHDIDGIYESLSRHTTFKTGDIIILPEILEQYTPQIQQEVRYNDILSFKIR